jgi:hypothetical protein
MDMHFCLHYQRSYTSIIIAALFHGMHNLNPMSYCEIRCISNKAEIVLHY